MSKKTRRHREHVGPKNSSAKSGYYGTRIEANTTGKKARREVDRELVVASDGEVIPFTEAEIAEAIRQEFGVEVGAAKRRRTAGSLMVTRRLVVLLQEATDGWYVDRLDGLVGGSRDELVHGGHEHRLRTLGRTQQNKCRAYLGVGSAILRHADVPPSDRIAARRKPVWIGLLLSAS
ncbi:MAG: hypothetical protein ACYDDA_04950 [Acidiferrobacteraceae bacterium]